MYVFYTECCEVDVSDKTLDVYVKTLDVYVKTLEDNFNYVNNLNLINFNVFICMFLLACILSFLCRDDKKRKNYEKYVAINTTEQKIPHYDIINIKR